MIPPRFSSTLWLALVLWLPVFAGAAESSHKVFAAPGILDGREGVTLEHDYGAFRLYRISDETLRNLPASLRAQVRHANDTDRLLFDARIIDTRSKGPSRALDSAGPGFGLHLVQFIGPIRDAWLAELRAAGGEPIQYIAHNGYLVRADGAARARLDALAAEGRILQYSAPYAADLKLGPTLRQRLDDPRQRAGAVDVVVQMLRHPRRAASEASIDALDLASGNGWSPVLQFQNRYATVRLEDVAAIAGLPDVTWIGERLPRELFDEVQAQIVAGNFDGTGTMPAGPGYKTFLDGLAFSQDPADYPIVDIVDGGVGQGDVVSGDPTLHEGGDDANPTRLAYLVNCTLEADGGGDFDGHGHINASIAGGFDLRAGFPFQDPNDYQRGLGINPYGRLAGTRVFEPFGFELRTCGGTPAELLRGQQDRGARISSNSWGCPGCADTYDDFSQAFDVGVRDADFVEPGNQELTLVFAAGNTGPFSATIGSPGNGKNMITVGASENVRPEDEDGPWLDGCVVFPHEADNAMDMADFSSRGPAPGGRIKPEIVAPGTHVQGTASPDPLFAVAPDGVCDPYRPSGQTTFSASSGTSHSTPAISGLISLITWWLENGRGGTVLDARPDGTVVDASARGSAAVESGGGASPSPALIKAYLMAHPTYLSGLSAGDTLPSNAQGYGMPDMNALFADTPELIHDQSHVFTDSGGTWKLLAAVADPALPLRITLAYTDAAGMIGTSPQVNDLDLVATVAGETYRGNVMSGAWSVSGGVADSANNYEAIYLPASTTGDIEITVTAFNIAGDGVPSWGDSTDQDFALVCDNCVARSAFTLDVSPPNLEVCTPSDAVYTIDVGSLSGFAAPVDLALTGEPAGTSVAWSANPVMPAGSAQLTIGGTGAAAAGIYGLELSASGGEVSQMRQPLLVLTGAAPAAPGLVAPAAGAQDVELRPSLEWSEVAEARGYRLEIATDAAFSEIVHAAAVKATSYPLTIFQLDPASHYFWRVRAVNACGDGPWSAPFELSTVRLPDVLVVDDDGGFPNVFSFYADALDALGVPFDVKGPGLAGEPTYYEIKPYSYVIWFVGKQFITTAGPGSAAEEALSRYLDEGGSLFISAQDWIRSRGITGLMTEYLGLAAATEDVDHETVTGLGPLFGGFGSHDLDYPFTNHSDLLTPDATAELVISSGQGGAGLFKDNGAYRTLYWGFPFEALPTPQVRAQAMALVLEALGRSSMVFADGFESGDLSAWSSNSP